MKWIRIGVVVIVVFIASVYGFGSAMPSTHTAAVSADYAASADEIYDVIADPTIAPLWRTGVDSVHIDPAAALFTWTEYSSFGAMTMVHERAVRPRILVARIADESDGFGGTWTYELQPAGDRTRLTITERGIVHSPLFRFASRYVFGHYRTLEQVARDLGERFGEDVEVRRVKDVE